MATCHIYNTRGQETAKVLFDPYPPDTAGTVVSVGGRVIGSIKSEHGLGGGDIYDSGDKLVGSTDGMRGWGDRPAFADDLKKHTIGVVRNASQIQRSPADRDDYDVGTVVSDSWTANDSQGLEDAARVMGREVTPKLVELMQSKQRSLAGVAALLLNCV